MRVLRWTDRSPLPGERAYRLLSRIAFRAVHLGALAAGTSSDDLSRRRGELPDAGAPLLWFHGASAGEMAAAEKLAALLGAAGYRFTAGYTSTNRAGVEHAGRSGGDAVASLAPWDSPAWVERAFERWRPRALFLVETELWPSLILTAARRDVPILCVSARIYPRDARRYALLRRWIGPLLQLVGVIAAQSDAECERFVAIGAPRERCRAAGNLKYLDAPPHTDGRAAARDLGIVPSDRVIVAGSVHRDEVRPILAALEPLVRGGARLVIAPRRPDAETRVLSECARRGLAASRRSLRSQAEPWQVLLLDTYGELERLYAAATLAVVGGGFGRHGGHNPHEPLLAGVPVVLGPHFDHFPAEAAALTAVAPEGRALDAHELGTIAAALLADTARRRALFERQRSVLPDAARIARAYRDAVTPVLETAGLAAAKGGGAALYRSQRR